MKFKRGFNLLLLVVIICPSTTSLAQPIVLWDFEEAGSPPPGWTNEWGACDPFGECDIQNLAWVAEGGELIAPLYSAENGEMDTIALSPVFKSIPLLGAGGNGGAGPFLRFLLSYEPSKLVPMGDSNMGDTLEIRLLTVGTSEFEEPINLPLNDSTDWVAMDREDGTPSVDNAIIVSQPLAVNTEYRLRVRAHDNDTGIGTFDGISIDDIAVTDGVVVLPGDFNADGNVNGYDFLRWQQADSPNPLSGSDLLDWQNQYGSLRPTRATASAHTGA